MGSLLPIAQRSPPPYQRSLIPGAITWETAYSRRLGDAVASGSSTARPMVVPSGRLGRGDGLARVRDDAEAGASVDRLVGHGVYVASAAPGRSPSGFALRNRLNVIAPSGSGMTE
jgi:hypothetical protein